MPSYTQANQTIEILTPLGKDVLLITSFRGEESLSHLFHFRVDMIADAKKDIAFDKVLGQRVAIRLTTVAGKPRFFSGICNRFSQGEGDGDFIAYHLEIVPQFWLLTKKAQTRIFQQKSVPDILKKVLEGLDVAYQIEGTFQPRNYCVQYRETDFNFASRLMEEEGIYYFFTFTADGHKMVVANTPASHAEMPLNSQLLYAKAFANKWQEDRIVRWEKQQELVTGQHTIWDHHFEMNGKNLAAKKTVLESVQVGKATHKVKAGNAESREVYDFPGEYANRFDGIDPGGGDQAAELKKILQDNERVVGIRSQQEAVLSVMIHGDTTCRNLVSGHKFTLQKHGNGNGDYVITAIQHHATTPIDYVSNSRADFRYLNSVTAIPLAMPFRPQRKTPKPFVQGTQTATVVGPPGEEIFCDKYGRVKVQFHWDREGKFDAQSSCWMRVAQVLAGTRWGASFWPRIGQEVVVSFLEGDPDQPLIIGSVYNASHMPPYLGDALDSNHANDKKISGIKSNTTLDGEGFNEWRFDDTKGKEQIFFHAQRNMDTRVLNDSNELVLNDRHLIVGAEKDGVKSGNQIEKVFKDKSLQVLGNQEELIAGDFKLMIGHGGNDAGGNVHIVIEKNKHELIEGESHLHFKKNHSVLVDGAVFSEVKGDQATKVVGSSSTTVTKDRNEQVSGDQSLKVDGKYQLKVGSNYAVDADSEVHLKSKKVIIEGASQISLVVGGNFIDISSSGINIVGSIVNINSGGSAGSGSGSSPTAPGAPTAPTDATQSAPGAPTPADNSKSGQKSTLDVKSMNGGWLGYGKWASGTVG